MNNSIALAQRRIGYLEPNTPEAVVPILIVDDSTTKRLAIKSVLSPLGYGIVEADSGVAALRCVMAQEFAVILLDVCMPITDGFETAALIRQRPQSEWTPIIFITGFASDELLRTDGYPQGAADFIFAPVPPNELRSKVSVFAKLFLRAKDLTIRAHEVQASADQLRLLTEAAPIGIFQTDSDNRFVYTNPRWTDIVGVPAESAAGQKWVSLIGADPNATLNGHVANANSYRGELNQRMEIQLADSTPRIVHITSTPLPDEHGGVAGWVGTLADVTAEAGAEAAMSDARDAAVVASTMQKKFAASASHELRTPTTSILGYAEEMGDSETMSEQDRGFLAIVYRNAQRLSQLIDDLLILDEAEIGASMMHLEPTALAPVVERVISNFATAAEHVGITVKIDHTPDLPPALVDPLRLEQALTNLVSNAVKFTPNDGEITISIQEHDGSVQISVTDTGPGIDPADIDNIFERFYRTRTALDSMVKGSGLGLAIAKRMIEAQNGQLDVTSELGHGSTFTITLLTAIRLLKGDQCTT